MSPGPGCRTPDAREENRQSPPTSTADGRRPMSRPETRPPRLPLAERPLVAAPMAGGPTTGAPARAVGAAGGFAFLAGGYKNPDVLRAEIEELSRDGRDFGVNLFVPDRSAVDPDAFRRYREQLRSEADRYGLDLPTTPPVDPDGWEDLLALLQRNPVPVVSLTFGLPARHDIRALQRAGSRVLATVTTADEARAAEEAAVDGLVVQGPAAGGHSGTHDPARDPRDVHAIDAGDTVAVVRQVLAAVDLPVVAAGGVDGPDAVRRLLEAGAAAVAVG